MVLGGVQAKAQKAGHSFAHAFSSKEALINALRTDEDDNPLLVGNQRWSNKDLEPTGPEQRTWRWWHLALYWGSSAYGTAGWNAAASLIAVGLTWQQAFISCFLGSFISALVVVGMARPGATYHIGYPVLCRSVMGMYGSYFFVGIRAVVGTIWYGIQTFYGANLLSTCLWCVFGDSWNNFPNHLPITADVTSKQLLCFFLVWLIELPFCFVHPTKIRHLFTVKGAIMPFAAFGLFGWCMANGGGIDAISVANNAVVQGVPTFWAVMSGINAVMGTLSPLLVNQPDLARYCLKPSDAGWPQGLAVFASKTLVFFLGLASTASIQNAWGKAYWNIWDLLNAILGHIWTPAARCAVFIVSFAFFFSTIGTNLGSNSIPFGADLTGLFPRYLTIRRGQVLCAFIGVALVPWKLIATAQTFITFLGSYSIFMSPLCAIIMTDYILSKKGNIHVPSLYDSRKSALYMYNYGVNYRGIFAWCGAVSLGLPGLVAAYKPNSVGDAAKNMYKMGWVLTFITATVLYAAGVLAFPRKTYPIELVGSVPKTWEYMAKSDGFFEGEREGDSVDERSGSSIEGVEAVNEKTESKVQKLSM